MVDDEEARVMSDLSGNCGESGIAATRGRRSGNSSSGEEDVAAGIADDRVGVAD